MSLIIKISTFLYELCFIVTKYLSGWGELIPDRIPVNKYRKNDKNVYVITL